MIFGACPAPILDHKTIVLGHGSGGKLTHQLIQKMILPAFRNPFLEAQHDGAVFSMGGARVAFSTDSYVVNPVFFPGGNIGDLAVNGTVNDLAMCGARPQYLSASFIIEEGLAMDDFWRILCSMKAAADAAGVVLVTGDTKVIDRGKGDKIFINTSGLGVIPEGVTIDPSLARPGDVIIVSGPIASHGMAIMSVREGLEFETPIESDTAPMNGLVEAILGASSAVHVLRDPTRGGVASVLNEIAEQSGHGIVIDEASVPVRSEVHGACEILGLDPLYVANEGRLLAFVSSVDAEKVLGAMRAHPFGLESAVIGEVVPDHPGLVVMKTRVGGSRVVDMLSGEQLPRIC
jgi:hydrogenase expression/formation protein HypE